MLSFLRVAASFLRCSIAFRIPSTHSSEQPSAEYKINSSFWQVTYSREKYSILSNKCYVNKIKIFLPWKRLSRQGPRPWCASRASCSRTPGSWLWEERVCPRRRFWSCSTSACRRTGQSIWAGQTLRFGAPSSSYLAELASDRGRQSWASNPVEKEIGNSKLSNFQNHGFLRHLQTPLDVQNFESVLVLLELVVDVPSDGVDLCQGSPEMSFVRVTFRSALDHVFKEHLVPKQGENINIDCCTGLMHNILKNLPGDPLHWSYQEGIELQLHFWPGLLVGQPGSEALVFLRELLHQASRSLKVDGEL